MNVMKEKLTDHEFEYLLKELELHASGEKRAREIIEQMAQYYLTAVTATAGVVVAILSTSPGLFLSLIAVLVGTLGALVFTVFLLLRACNFREAITLTVLRTWHVRSTIASYGIRPANQFLPDKGEKLITGFSGRILFYLTILAVFCGLLTSVVIASIIVIWREFLGLTFNLNSTETFYVYILPPLVGFLLCVSSLLLVVKRYRDRTKILELGAKTDVRELLLVETDS